MMHCRWKPERFYAVIGAHDLTSPSGNEVIHEVVETSVFDYFNWEYNSAIPDNDVALLTVSEK